MLQNKCSGNAASVWPEFVFRVKKRGTSLLLSFLLFGYASRSPTTDGETKFEYHLTWNEYFCIECGVKSSPAGTMRSTVYIGLFALNNRNYNNQLRESGRGRPVTAFLVHCEPPRGPKTTIKKIVTNSNPV